MPSLFYDYIYIKFEYYVLMSVIVFVLISYFWL